VSELSYGTWVNFPTVPKGEDGSKGLFELMKVAYLGGCNTFDTAEAYGTDGAAETLLGRALLIGFEQKLWDRADLVIITKIFFGAQSPNVGNSKMVNKQGLSRKHIIEGLKASLKRLNLDYVDVVMAHRPDVITPIEEVVRGFNQCIDLGLTFYWGTSEWSAQQIQEAFKIADKLGLVPPCADQVEYSLLHKTRVESEYLPLYPQGLGLTTWSPLASGVLSGKYKGQNVPPGSRLTLDLFKGRKDLLERAEKAELVRPIADKLGCSMSQVSLAWILKNKNVSTVIMGATSVEQLTDNLGALKIVDKLTPDIMSQLDSILKHSEEKPAVVNHWGRDKKLRHLSDDLKAAGAS